MKSESLETRIDKLFLEDLSRAYPNEIKPPELRVRDGRVLDLEHRLHHGPSGRRRFGRPRLGLDGWTADHSSSVEGIDPLPYWPNLLKSQRLERASTPINRFILSPLIPEANYLKFYRWYFNRAVGSKKVADEIVERYNTTPAFADESLSITDYAIHCLENDISFGVSSAHLDRLADVGEFGAGLSLAVALRKGRQYTSNFKVLINKNMTRERYKGIPIPLLTSLGIVAYWGLPPGESAEKYQIPDDVMEEVNLLLIEQYRKDRKLGAVALSFVPAGSRPDKLFSDDGSLEAMMLKRAYTGSFMTRCEGGIVVGNRVGDEIEVSNVIPIEAGNKRKTKAQLVDDVNLAHATQGARLAGVPVSFESEVNDGEVISVNFKKAA